MMRTRRGMSVMEITLVVLITSGIYVAGTGLARSQRQLAALAERKLAAHGVATLTARGVLIAGAPQGRTRRMRMGFQVEVEAAAPETLPGRATRFVPVTVRVYDPAHPRPVETVHVVVPEVTGP